MSNSCPFETEQVEISIFMRQIVDTNSDKQHKYNYIHVLNYNNRLWVFTTYDAPISPQTASLICSNKISLVDIGKTIHFDGHQMHSSSAKLLSKQYITMRFITYCKTFDDRVEFYYREKKWSFNDEPSIVYSNGNKKWYHNDLLHRENDKPAFVYHNDDQFWYTNGELHREGDLPAAVYKSGAKLWYHNGKLHREGNKPAIIQFDGRTEYYLNGVRYTPKNLNNIPKFTFGQYLSAAPSADNKLRSERMVIALPKGAKDISAHVDNESVIIDYNKSV